MSATVKQRVCSTDGCGRMLSQGAAGNRCRACYESQSVAGQQRAAKTFQSGIVVYTVCCPDCGRSGRIAHEGIDSPVDLDMLYCPDCEPGTPPMEVLFKGKPI